LNEAVNLVLAISGISSFLEVNSLLLITAPWRVKLEWPQKFVGVLEILSNSVDLVDEIFNTHNSLVVKSLLNERIVGDGNSLASDLQESTFVNEMLDSLQIWGSVSNVRFNQLQHLADGSVQSNKNSIVDLSQTKQLQNLSSLGVNSIDTSNTNDDSKTRLRFSEEISTSSSLSAKTD